MGKLGELNHRAKLTPTDVDEIRATGQSQTALALRFGVTISTISDIRLRRSWQHLPDPPFRSDDPSEKWRPVTVDGFQTRYEVSDHGHIRSVKLQRAIRRAFISPAGYQRIVLWNDYRKRYMFVHRVVATAFLGPVPDGYEVNHIDGNKANNAVTNLEYVTPQANIAHAVKHGLTARGERNRNAKLTTEAVLAIRQATGDQSVIGQTYGVSQSLVSQIQLRKIWRHI